MDSKINCVSETMYYEDEEGDCFEYEGPQRWLQGKVDKEGEKVNNGHANKENWSDVVSELSAETEDCRSNSQQQKGSVTVECRDGRLQQQWPTTKGQYDCDGYFSKTRRSHYPSSTG